MRFDELSLWVCFARFYIIRLAHCERGIYYCRACLTPWIICQLHFWWSIISSFFLIPSFGLFPWITRSEFCSVVSGGLSVSLQCLSVRILLTSIQGCCSCDLSVGGRSLRLASTCSYVTSTSIDGRSLPWCLKLISTFGTSTVPQPPHHNVRPLQIGGHHEKNSFHQNFP